MVPFERQLGAVLEGERTEDRLPPRETLAVVQVGQVGCVDDEESTLPQDAVEGLQNGTRRMRDVLDHAQADHRIVVFPAQPLHL